MRDLTRTTDFGVAAHHPSGDLVEASAIVDDRATETVPVLEETLRISKRQVLTGRVRVSTKTETHDVVAEATLDRTVVDVTHVTVGEFVDVAPATRTEGDTTIVPVIEERLVLVKRLFLVEELHIRHHVEHETVSQTVPLRRQTVTIERVDASGDNIVDPPVEG